MPWLTSGFDSGSRSRQPPFVTWYKVKTGYRMHFSANAMKLMDPWSHPYAMLYYDPDTKLSAMEMLPKSAANTPGALCVTVRRSFMAVACNSFCRKFGIEPPKGSVKYEVRASDTRPRFYIWGDKELPKQERKARLCERGDEA